MKNVLKKSEAERIALDTYRTHSRDGYPSDDVKAVGCLHNGFRQVSLSGSSCQ